MKKLGRPKGSKKIPETSSNVKEIWYTKSYTDVKYSDEKILILRGGAGSGKSWGVLQYLLECLFAYDGIHILISRKNFTSLRKPALSC